MNHFFVKSLLFASLVFSASALCWAVVRLILSILNKKGNKNCLVWYSLLFVLATWCLRYSVGYYSIFYPNEYITSGLTEFEEVFNSVIHTLQSFSIDEKYTEYIAAGKEMIKLVYGENSRCVTAYGIYASVLNMLAPICGGAILLDILQGVFPGAKLFFKTLAWWKNKYYFSELNESSLACAKSIISQKRRLFNKPVIVFTDVYTDGENEKSSELFKKAKALGAICMNDDITRFSNRFISKKEFWLIDENEIENIKTLAELTSDEHYKRIKKVIIRIFYHDDSYALTESGIAKQVKEKYENLILYEFRKRKIPTVIRLRITELSLLFKNTDGSSLNEQSLNYKIRCFLFCLFGIFKLYRLKKLKETSESNTDIKEKLNLIEEVEKEAKEILVRRISPAVIRVRCYQNLIYNLLRTLPLYQPLIGREKPESLNIAVLGNGNIGMEMFLSSFWCGQLLDIPLSINVTAKDTPEVACAKIDKISREILESTKPNSEILCVFSDDKTVHSPPYCTFRYLQSDVACEDISKLKCKIPDELMPPNELTDEAVACDFPLADADYFLVALGEDDINIRVAEMLYREVSIRLIPDKKVIIAYVVYDSHLCEAMNKTFFKSDAKVIMKAVGSIDETYSFDNIFNREYMAEKLNKTDSNSDFSHEDWMNLTNLMAINNKAYNFWSDYARDIHYKYKLFSAYTSINPKCEFESFTNCHKEYICKEKDYLADRIAWLEHRRWVAYIRSIGFVESKNKDVVNFKTHDCLIEHKDPDLHDTRDSRLEELRKSKEDKKHIIDYDYFKVIPQEEYKRLFDETEMRLSKPNKGETVNV